MALIWLDMGLFWRDGGAFYIQPMLWEAVFGVKRLRQPDNSEVNATKIMVDDTRASQPRDLAS